MSKVLDLTLLAVLRNSVSDVHSRPLFLRSSNGLDRQCPLVPQLDCLLTCADPALSSLAVASTDVDRGKTNRPLGKPEVHLSSLLGSQPLVLLERATDNARCDGEVAVVAV